MSNNNNNVSVANKSSGNEEKTSNNVQVDNNNTSLMQEPLSSSSSSQVPKNNTNVENNVNTKPSKQSNNKKQTSNNIKSDDKVSNEKYYNENVDENGFIITDSTMEKSDYNSRSNINKSDKKMNNFKGNNNMSNNVSSENFKNKLINNKSYNNQGSNQNNHNTMQHQQKNYGRASNNSGGSNNNYMGNNMNMNKAKLAGLIASDNKGDDVINATGVNKMRKGYNDNYNNNDGENRELSNNNYNKGNMNNRMDNRMNHNNMRQNMNNNMNNLYGNNERSRYKPPMVRNQDNFNNNNFNRSNFNRRGGGGGGGIGEDGEPFSKPFGRDNEGKFGNNSNRPFKKDNDDEPVRTFAIEEEEEEGRKPAFGREDNNRRFTRDGAHRTFGREGGGNNFFYRNYKIPKTAWATRDNRRYYGEKNEDIYANVSTEKGVNFELYDSIPVELKGYNCDNIVPVDSFQDSTLNLNDILLANIKRVNYDKTTPIQKYSLSIIMNKNDLIGVAQTGSGKTAGYLLPIINHMLMTGPPNHTFYEENNKSYNYYYNRVCLPICLILAPTRELAVQIFCDAKKFCFETGIKPVVLYGGSSIRIQLSNLDKGADIIVATPGRLNDILEKGKIKLFLTSFLVLDEADRMLDMGFSPQIRSIVNDFDMPGNDRDGFSNENKLEYKKYINEIVKRQTIMFSATFKKEIQVLAREYLCNYTFLSVGKVGSTNEYIKQNLVYVEEDDKCNSLVELLTENNNGLTIIFVETKRKTTYIERFLQNQRLNAVAIHGDKTQDERERALKLFKKGVKNILVATDVAARGLDISNIKHVINFDLPNNIDDYIHRIGRTGRAGNIGIATSFVNGDNKNIFRDLLATLEECNQEVPRWFLNLVMKYTASARSNRNYKYNNKPMRNMKNNFSRNNNNNNNNSGFGNNNYHNNSGFGNYQNNNMNNGGGFMMNSMDHRNMNNVSNNNLNYNKQSGGFNNNYTYDNYNNNHMLEGRQYNNNSSSNAFGNNSTYQSNNNYANHTNTNNAFNANKFNKNHNNKKHDYQNSQNSQKSLVQNGEENAEAW
uniref:RNA helicase n=1 Tax=Piliocolobus tephrosceles TaxID=591936 RepID=A0A8C9GKJ2_9PRIM